MSGPGAGGRFRRIDQLERGADRLPPLLACVEVKPELAQRQVGLGREDEDEQAGPQIEVAGDESEAHPDGDERDRQRGEELEREGRQERDRAAPPSSRPGSRSVMRSSASTWARARPKTLRVGRPWTTSRKWWARRRMACQRRRRWPWAARPTSTMNATMTGIVRATVAAAMTSARRRLTTTAAGTMTASATWGRYFAKYASRASTPRVASATIPPVPPVPTSARPGLVAARRRGPGTEPHGPLEDRAAQPRTSPPPTRGGRSIPGPRQRPHDRSGRARARRASRRARRSVAPADECPADGVGEEAGLHDRQRGGDQPEKDRDGEMRERRAGESG